MRSFQLRFFVVAAVQCVNLGAAARLTQTHRANIFSASVSNSTLAGGKTCCCKQVPQNGVQEAMTKPGRFLYQVSQAYYICKMDSGFFGTCSMGYQQPSQSRALSTYFTQQKLTPCSSAKARSPKAQRAPQFTQHLVQPFNKAQAVKHPARHSNRCDICTHSWMCGLQDYAEFCLGCPVCDIKHEAATTFECGELLAEWEVRHPGQKVLKAKNDGNCFYYSMARLCGAACDNEGKCRGTSQLRELVANFLEANPADFVDEKSEDVLQGLKTRDQFIADVRSDGFWASGAEMHAAGFMHGFKVNVLSFGDGAQGEYYEPYERTMGIDNADAEMTFMYCGNHWMPVASVVPNSNGAFETQNCQR